MKAAANPVMKPAFKKSTSRNSRTEPSAFVDNHLLDAPKALNRVALKNICPANGEDTPCKGGEQHDEKNQNS